MRKCVADLEGNGFLTEVTKVHCGVFIDVQTQEVHKFRPNEINKMLNFMDTCDVLIFHNGYGYDFPVLKKLYDYTYKNQKQDTLVLSRMLYPDRLPPKGVRAGPHSVESWGVSFGRQKPVHEDWSTFSEDMLHRCEEDCWIQLALYDQCLQRAKRDNWPARSFSLGFKLFEIFGLQEQNGWPVDVPRIQRNIHLLEKWVRKIDQVLVPKLPNVLDLPYKDTPVRKPFKQDRTLAATAKNWYTSEKDRKCISGPFTRIEFRKVNLNSTMELKQFLLQEGWKPKEWNYKKDPVTKRLMKDENNNLIASSPKLKHDDPFRGINGRIGTLAAKRVQSNSRKSILEGWLNSVREDGTIAQRITGIAATGRLTHSGIVNVPGGDAFFGKQMRSVFSTLPGYSVVGTDSAGCQNRMLAGRVQDPAFTEILINGDKKKGTSIHQVNQAAIKKIAGFDVTYAESKTLNYAFMFGAMDKKLGSTLQKSPQAGAKIREALLSISPGFKKLVDSLTEEWKQTAQPYINDWGRPDLRNGTIKGLDGRPIRIKSEKDVLVYTLQSDEAILMQTAQCFLYKWLLQKGWTYGKEFMFVAIIHDEFQTLVRDDKVQEYIELADKSITYAGEYLKIQCPHEGESNVGKNWAETH